MYLRRPGRYASRFFTPPHHTPTPPRETSTSARTRLGGYRTFHAFSNVLHIRLHSGSYDVEPFGRWSSDLVDPNRTRSSEYATCPNRTSPYLILSLPQLLFHVCYEQQRRWPAPLTESSGHPKRLRHLPTVERNSSSPRTTS